MSLAKDPTLRTLDDCGCCEGVGAMTPLEIYNRPGLEAVVYRIGTHADFKQSMLARLSSQDLPALQALRTRDEDDFTIALLDAWATTADVLSFYQERIANESYLRTATEEKSLYYLARLIGYRPSAGVAASTYLAFNVEDADGAPTVTSIATGNRVQSIPGPGEKPQIFETIEAIEARPEWNALRPRMSQEQLLSKSMQYALFDSVLPNLKNGDTMLVVEDADLPSWEVKKVVNVETDTKMQTTKASFVTDTIIPKPFILKLYNPGVFLVQPLKLTASLVGSKVLKATWKQASLSALTRVQRWPAKSLLKNLRFQLKKREVSAETGVFLLKQQAAIFGHNAPQFISLSEDQKTVLSNWDSPARTLYSECNNDRYVYLDRVYEGIIEGNWIVLVSPSAGYKAYKVDEVSSVSRADFTLSGKVTRLRLDSNVSFNSFKIRETTVYIADSEPLQLADLPITDNVPSSNEKNAIVLDIADLYLKIGQRLILSGEREDLEGVTESELVTIADAIISDGYTKLTFSKALQNTYIRNTVSLNANVASATHGEQKKEVLGNGDGKAVFQSFKLRQPPLTYVPASMPSGSKSTLEISVNNIKWKEVSSLYGQSPNDRVYVVRTDDEGETFATFGDGRTGARLPTGSENVQASYRKGMGEEGLVEDNQLTLLLTRPLGVRGVTNPIAASGAQDRESRDQVRDNTPLAIMTLDRMVSLQDYEDFARAFAGISKALATWTWDGQHQGVFVTVSGPNGAEVKDESATYKNLIAAMHKAGDPLVPLQVKTYRAAFFCVEATVKMDPDYDSETLINTVEAELRDRFGFEKRNFGEAVTRSDVISNIQQVPGVIAVDVDYLYRTDAQTPTLETVLEAKIPQAGTLAPLAAELLTLDPRPVSLGVTT